MSDAPAHEILVEALARDLRPVRPLPSPLRRGLAWCAAALGLALLTLPFVDVQALRLRMGVPDLALAALGAVLTAAAAAFAAFCTSVPGRSPRWALLPLPPAALWLAASGLGCLRAWIAPGTDLPDAGEMRGCAVFLVAVSLPLSLLLAAMLRRACPLRPVLTAALAGLAAAAAAAAILVLFHPHDATGTDLAVHAATVAVVIGANALAGGRLLGGGRAPPPHGGG
ncbi:NrsF family protein [Methylobacterium sp. WSM2598]|uniref:NrsF family protein n=1 Tax=Methylobacterium sp. WSM2598 TaxID=398261 RepID=UPI000379DDB2|nr:NrsF family protein [Methylobacterium sp. WSM2598]